MPSFVYNEGALRLQRGSTGGVDFLVDTIKILLLKSGMPDKDHQFVSDLAPATNEVTVAGYARQVLGLKTLTKDTVNDRVIYDAADAAFGTLATGETVIAAVVYKDTVADTTSPLLFYVDFTDTPTNGSTFTVQFASTGIAYLQQ